MTTLPLTTVEEATPEHLSVLLGHHVSSADVRSNDAFSSTVAYLELHFDDSRAPTKLFLKLNRDNAGREEVAFYKLAAEVEADTSMLVPCVSAAFDSGSGASHLLLRDISETHEAPVNREKLLALEGVPIEAHLRGVAETLAHFHATFWEHPRLDKHPATKLTERYRNRRAFRSWWTKHRKDYGLFAKAHGNTVSDSVHSLLQGALEHYPKVWKRYLEPRSTALSNLTVTHNDCYLTQFLCPKSEQGKMYLVDFQDACTDFAARDLVYLMATFWTREQRGVHERAVLEHYHHTLLEGGVRGYELERLFEDYRLMLVDMVFHPVWDTTYGADPAYWQPKLKCLTDAYLDWQCDALLH